MERDWHDVCKDVRGEHAAHPWTGRERTPTAACVLEWGQRMERREHNLDKSRKGGGTDTTKHGNGYIPDEVELDDRLPRRPLLVEVLGRERELEVCGL